MDLSYGASGSGDEENPNSRKGKKNYHRHSPQQIQRLEAFFKDFPHPDENQRRQLSAELGLDTKQIKFWFQNKRTQAKAQNERADNSALRAENERIHSENLALQEAMKSILCPACNASDPGEEEKLRALQKLSMENERLKQEHQQKIYHLNRAKSTAGIEFFPNLPENHFLGEEMRFLTPTDQEHMSLNSQNPFDQNVMDRSMILEIAVASMDELLELLRLKDPVWMKSALDGRFMLNRDTYDKSFPKDNHFKTASARIESSKDSGEVAMAARHLIEMLLDANKWRDMFPTIVTNARTIGVVDTGSIGGSLNLMYEQMHILSPLVSPREFYFIRYCRQLNSNTWVMVDVSCDFIKDIQYTAPNRSWKLPSGCMIEDISNGKSSVTWIEHVQVDDRPVTHRLYRDIVCGSQAYGAKRWVTTLQRMCERFAFSMGLAAPNHELEAAIGSPEGRRNLMRLSNRMVKDFCEILSMSDKLDFPHLSELKNSGIRVSLRKCDGPGQPNGLVVSAASSLWLPVSNEDVFNFLKDEQKRSQWDVLASGNPVAAIAQMSTGAHQGNCISIIQPFVPKAPPMLMLQESFIDPLGATLIYAPIDLSSISLAVGGEDITILPLLPSGYVISKDNHQEKGIGSSKNTSGSLLTVCFQILVCCNTSKQLDMESVATVHTLISSTIQRIREAMGCAEED